LSDDPLKPDLKADEAHIRREDVADVMVFAIENENVYPKQAGEIAAVIRALALSAPRPKILVDLSRVQFISSAFIGNLADLQKLASEKSGSLKICVTGGHVAYTMKLVKLNKLIEIAGDRQTLLDSFQTSP